MTAKRQWLMGLAIMCTSVFVLSGAAVAATTPEVTGTVTFNGAAAADASVNISCAAAGGGQHVRNLTTSSTGRYDASFLAGQCNDGAQVVVTAVSSDGSSSGQAVGMMGDGTPQRVEINVSIAAPTALPEFVPATALFALFASAGIMTFLRRREFRRSLG